MTLKVPRLLLIILLLKILGTIFAVFIFAKFSSLGDSLAYLSGKHTVNSILSSRTALLGHLTVFLKSIFVFDFIVHLFFSVLSGIGLWFAVSSLPIISLKSRRLILLVFLSPSFLVWSGVVSKEAFVLFPLGLMAYCYFNVLQHKKILMNCLLCLFCFALVLFIRPNFFPVYFLIFFSTFFVLKAWFKYFSYGVLLVFVFFITLSSYYFIVQSFEYEIDSAISWSKIMFLSYDSDTNRYWVQWDSLSDYFLNMYWGIPFSIIGPLPSEVFHRIQFFPFFLEGFFYFGFLFYVDYFLYCTARCSRDGLRLFWIVILPSQILALLVFYPLGVFNPGSALRYKQPLIFVLYLFPILLREFLALSVYKK